MDLVWPRNRAEIAEIQSIGKRRAFEASAINAVQTEWSQRWLRSSSCDLPTQYHVVNAFAALPLKDFRGAALVHSKGGKDFSDQEIID